MIHPTSESINILLVDDNPTNLRVLSDSLKDQEDWRILFATDGESAIKQVQYAQPDLILLDVMMPGIDGFETCQRLKDDTLSASIPVIFMTALSDTAQKVQGLELGAVDYITKPFRQEEVLARIRLHLRLSGLSQDLERKNIALIQEVTRKETVESQLRVLNQELEERVDQRTSELSNSYQQLKQAQVQLIQQEKMASLGNLVAGVAHEINNPIGFLCGSVSNAKDYVSDLFQYIDVYQHHQPPTVPQVQDYAEEIDLSFIQEDFPKLLESMKHASDRITTISNSLRSFSRADTQRKTKSDIHEGLDSTLLILKYRLKSNDIRPEIQVIKNYGDIPKIDCFQGQLNQVFMNVLANAIDMFDEMALQYSFDELEANPQKITIKTTTSFERKSIEICLQDNGKGMTPNVAGKVFDHLFTTKEVGKGTGLGLAIAHQIVTETHGGKISVQSEMGQGTEFYIQLPVASL